MGSVIAAWLVGEGIIIYRSVKAYHAPPLPGSLLISSGVFVLIGLLAEAEKARFLAQALAWGFDLAAFANLMNIAPSTPASQNVVPWPPPIAPNVSIFPSGKYQESGTSGSSSPKPPTGTGPVAA